MFSRVTYRTLQWLVAAFALLHNAEEAWTIAAYAPEVRQRFADVAPAGLLLATTHLSWFYCALLFATIIPTLIVLAAVTGRAGRIAAWAVVFVQSLFLVNVVVPHVPAALVLGGYAPGVVTAMGVELPFSIYFLRRSVREGVVSGPGAAWTVSVAALALPLLLGVLYTVASA